MKHTYIKPEIKALRLRLNTFIMTSPTSGSTNSQFDGPDGPYPIEEGQDDPNKTSRWMRQSIWDD